MLFTICYQTTNTTFCKAMIIIPSAPPILHTEPLTIFLEKKDNINLKISMSVNGNLIRKGISLSVVALLACLLACLLLAYQKIIVNKSNSCIKKYRIFRSKKKILIVASS